MQAPLYHPLPPPLVEKHQVLLYVLYYMGFAARRNKKSEEERSPEGLEEAEKRLARPKKPLQKKRKRVAASHMLVGYFFKFPISNTEIDLLYGIPPHIVVRRLG